MIPSRVNLINVLVPVKRAIDYAVKIRIAKDGKGVDTTVKHSMVSMQNRLQRVGS
jgi:electron transfer flavoprotein beta subunit